MTRSRWSKTTFLSRPPGAPRKPTKQSNLTEDRSRLEKILEERVSLIYRQVEAAEWRKSSEGQRLLGLLLATSLLEASLVLAANGLQVRAGTAGSGLQLVFGLFVILAALLLALSMAIALGGSLFAASALAGISQFAAGMDATNFRSITREQLIKAALVRLTGLEKADRRLLWAFRWSAILFLAAILPFLIVVVLFLV